MAAYKDLVGQKITKVTSNPPEPKTGQMWYNSTSGSLKGLGILEAFSSASPLSTGRFNSGAGGTTSATWIAGGYEPSASNKTEEFNGTGFSSEASLNTARGGNIGTGVQTAGLTMGGGPGSSPYTSAATEEYDGSSWTTISPGLNTERLYSGAGGTQTAGVIFSGQTTPNATVRSTATEEYNGSSWTTVSGGNVNSGQGHLGGCGTQTAALKAGGDDPGGSSNNSEEYDGSTWTTGNNLNTARRADGTSGIQTQALVVGGYAPPGAKSVVESYDGTSFTETVDLATAQYYNTTSGNTNGTGVLSMGGAAGPPAVSTVEEYNKSTNTITAAAFSSGGAANFARRQLGYTGAGTQNAFMVYGGFSPSGMVNNSEEYGGATWTATPTLNTARGQDAGFGITTAAVCCGGATPTIGGYTEEYNGSSWTTGNSMSTNRYEFGATGILTAGLALQGDQGPSTPFGTTCEQYDGTNWSSAGTASTARRTNSGVGTLTATITAGGQIPGPSATANVESYDGTSFSEVNNLNTARGGNAVMGGPAGATSSVITGGNVPTQFSISEQWNGTSMVTGASMANDRSTHGAGGTSASGIVGLGQIGPSPPYGDADTEEYVGETTAANIEDFSTS